MNIRKATPADLPAMLAIYENARRFMVRHGNPTQWGTTDPSEAQLKSDIANGNSYLCEADGKIAAAFYYKEGPDPTYAKIYQGSWPSEAPYGVVHRVASAGTVKGAGSFCLEWAFGQCGNLRIDTHRDNLVMQGLLKKLGFQQCGIILVENGSERIAYQKSK